jgi:hypothetical protein
MTTMTMKKASLRIGGLDLQLLKILIRTEHEMGIEDSPFLHFIFCDFVCSVL